MSNKNTSLKTASNRLNNRSDNRSVELTVNRSGIPVEIYLAHLELVANGGINELDSVLTESVAAHYINQESADATVSRVEQPLINELCYGLLDGYMKGKTNG